MKFTNGRLFFEVTGQVAGSGVDSGACIGFGSPSRQALELEELIVADDQSENPSFLLEIVLGCALLTALGVLRV